MHKTYRLLLQETIQYLKQEYVPTDTLAIDSKDFQKKPLVKPLKVEPPIAANPLPIKKAPSQPIAIKIAEPAKPKKEISPSSVPHDRQEHLVKKEEPIPSDVKARIEEIFRLEPLPPAASLSIEEIKKQLLQVAPGMAILDEPLDDARAQLLAQAWKEHLQGIEVVVLSFGEKEQELQFLTQLAHAIDSHLAPCKVVNAIRLEKEKKWDLFLQVNPLRQILAPLDTIHKSSDLKRYYKEKPLSSEKFIGKIPFLSLSSPADYLQNRELKKDLWKQLGEILKG